MTKCKRILKIVTAGLSGLLFAGLIWVFFLPRNNRGGWGEPPSGKSCVYLYPETETMCQYVDLDQYKRPDYAIWLAGSEEEAQLCLPGVYVISPDGTLTSAYFRNKDHRFHWERVSQITYPTHPAFKENSVAIVWGSFHVVADLSEGWCVPGKETEAFLRDILPQTGLSETECADLLAAWLPELKGRAYHQFTFCIGDTPLEIYEGYTARIRTDRIDSTLRVFLLTRPLDAPVELTPQTFEPFVREGFTVVQWGGVVIDK